jgi:hypothetical protein
MVHGAPVTAVPEDSQEGSGLTTPAAPAIPPVGAAPPVTAPPVGGAPPESAVPPVGVAPPLGAPPVGSIPPEPPVLGEPPVTGVVPPVGEPPEDVPPNWSPPADSPAVGASSSPEQADAPPKTKMAAIPRTLACRVLTAHLTPWFTQSHADRPDGDSICNRQPRPAGPINRLKGRRCGGWMAQQSVACYPFAPCRAVSTPRDPLRQPRCACASGMPFGTLCLRHASRAAG